MKKRSRKHLPYGIFKNGSSKIHPHNECGICGEDRVCKKSERQRVKKEIDKQIEEVSNEQ